MRHKLLLGLSILLLMGLAVGLAAPPAVSHAEDTSQQLITGIVVDEQNQPVSGAEVSLVSGDSLLAQATTQGNGRYLLTPTNALPTALNIQVHRSHFNNSNRDLTPSQIDQLRRTQALTLSDFILQRRVGLSFWIACGVFALMLILIAVGWLHRTLTVLLSATLLFGISYLGRPLNPDLFIFDFNGALHYVNWNVVFLMMGMMIIIAVIEPTGIFQWLAVRAYTLARGRRWLLVIILMGVTSVASAMLDNVTTMLLLTPITIQIALTLNMNPLALLMPELMASNIAGISTLIGTPTNILIGSHAGLSFSDFLINLTPGALLALVGLVAYSLFVYRRDLINPAGASRAIPDELNSRGKITQPGNLKKVGWVGLAMLLLFVFGERFDLVPAVTALMGASVLLFWVRPDVEEMIGTVDWTTLVFFIALFIVVGGVQEVGLISLLAREVGHVAGTSLILTMLIVIWSGALFSTVVANIPFTAAMLPVISYLSITVPGAESHVLFFSLAVGSALGGNGSLIGASANMVTAGIADRAGYPITYRYFLKRGLPALFVTVALATIWLFVRFRILG